MTRDFGSHAGHARLAVVTNEEAESGPGVVPEYKGLRLVLTIVSSGQMVMLGPENSELEVTRVRNIDMTIEAQVTIFIL